MGKPKSFKDLFKNKTQVPLHGGSKIVTPQMPSLPKEVKEKLERQKRDLLNFVNTQRCTVCGAQLDGGVNEKDAKLYCVANNDHYTCRYVPGMTLPEHCSALYVFTDQAIEFRVNAYHLEGMQYNNMIWQLDLNLIPKFRSAQAVKKLQFEGKLLRFPKNLEYEDFIKKLKVYTVFS